MFMLFRFGLVLLLIFLAFAAVWVVSSGVVRDQEPDELLNVACDPTREFWKDINEKFISQHEAQTGRKVRIKQSHGGSASQARAVIDGLDADIATLALWSDTDAIRRADRLQAGWEDRLPNRSLPFVSTIVMVVRKGNPKNIRNWRDLAREDVQVVTPNPKTSGNGKWSFLAMWAAISTSSSAAEAESLLRDVYSRVPVLDTSARGSTMTFAQKRIGDVHLTWENEAYLEVEEANGQLEIVTPSSSILAEPHVTLVDAVVDRKGTRGLAEEYLRFLYTAPAQELMVKHHFRPMMEPVRSQSSTKLPALRLIPITQIAHNWDEIQSRFFAEDALFDQIVRSRRRP
jgi:sulfate/thiosulfate transport system substrate-binding protein